MRIDAHQHYWRLSRRDYGWLTPALGPIHRDFGPADLAPLLEAAGIARTILVQAAPTEAETAFLLGLAREHETIAGVVGWANFDASDAPRRIAALARAEPLLVGLRPMIHDIADINWVLAAAPARAFAAMTKAGLVFDALVRPPHLPRIRAIAHAHPDLAIVIDHCAKPLIRERIMEPWAQDMRALAECENVSVKLSGLATEAAPNWQVTDLAPYVGLVLQAFGPRRVLWGSDWPVLNLAGDYARWVAATDTLLAGLPEPARAAILGGNAGRIYLGKRGRG